MYSTSLKKSQSAWDIKLTASQQTSCPRRVAATIKSSVFTIKCQAGAHPRRALRKLQSCPSRPASIWIFWKKRPERASEWFPPAQTVSRPCSQIVSPPKWNRSPATRLRFKQEREETCNHHGTLKYVSTADENVSSVISSGVRTRSVFTKSRNLVFV